jgi:hypothetical protein
MANDAGQIARAAALEAKRKATVTPVAPNTPIAPVAPVTPTATPTIPSQMEAIKKLPQYQELLGK